MGYKVDVGTVPPRSNCLANHTLITETLVGCGNTAMSQWPSMEQQHNTVSQQHLAVPMHNTRQHPAMPDQFNLALLLTGNCELTFPQENHDIFGCAKISEQPAWSYTCSYQQVVSRCQKPCFFLLWYQNNVLKTILKLIEASKKYTLLFSDY